MTYLAIIRQKFKLCLMHTHIQIAKPLLFFSLTVIHAQLFTQKILQKL